MANLQDHQRALEEMAARNDHAGMARVVNEVEDGHLPDLVARLVDSLLADHPAKQKDILRDYEAARLKDKDAERRVFTRLLAFGSEDGRLALTVTDSMSWLFTELVHTVGMVGAMDRAAFEALMGDSVDTAEPIDREAAEERLASLRNCFKVMASVGDMVAQGGKVVDQYEPCESGDVALADLTTLCKSMARTVEGFVRGECGHDVPAKLAKSTFVGGWIAGTTAMVSGEGDARSILDTYLATLFKTRG